jgi:gamma-glutamylcyclotransferase (GGCT)/AIG2-like uncharacterized protein YtfP
MKAGGLPKFLQRKSLGSKFFGGRGTMPKVFVYGTLMKGFVHHDKLGQSKRLAEQAFVRGELYNTHEYYPAMIRGNGTVYGELYEVSEDVLKVLDNLEEYTGDPERDLYDRIKVQVTTDTGETEAYTYMLTEKKNTMIRDKVSYHDWKVQGMLHDEEILYFAYGSCMDDDRFIKAGVDQHFMDCIGLGVLPGYSLKFGFKGTQGHAADIVEDGGKAVEGKVYKINRDALEYLFKREGVNTGHYRPAIVSLSLNGKVVDNVLTFLVLDKHEEQAPTEIYATEILRGGRGTLSQEYWEALRCRIKDQFNIDVNV